MNETYEQEIDLKWLLYRVLRSWRGICLWAVIIGVVIEYGLFRTLEKKTVKKWGMIR